MQMICGNIPHNVLWLYIIRIERGRIVSTNILQSIKERYTLRYPVTKEEYEQKKQELSTEVFEAQYESSDYVDGDTRVYQFNKKAFEYSDEEVKQAMLFEQLQKQEIIEQHLRTIKGCVIFFTVLISLGIAAYIILMLA